MSKRLSGQWLYREWCRAAYLGGMHGLYGEGPKVDTFHRFLTTPHAPLAEVENVPYARSISMAQRQNESRNQR